MLQLYISISKKLFPLQQNSIDDVRLRTLTTNYDSTYHKIFKSAGLNLSYKISILSMVPIPETYFLISFLKSAMEFSSLKRCTLRNFYQNPDFTMVKAYYKDLRNIRSNKSVFVHSNKRIVS